MDPFLASGRGYGFGFVHLVRQLASTAVSGPTKLTFGVKGRSKRRARMPLSPQNSTRHEIKIMVEINLTNCSETVWDFRSWRGQENVGPEMDTRIVPFSGFRQ